MVYHGRGTDHIPSVFIGMVGYIDLNRNGEPDHAVMITSVSEGRVKYSAHTRNVKMLYSPRIIMPGYTMLYTGKLIN